MPGGRRRGGRRRRSRRAVKRGPGGCYRRCGGALLEDGADRPPRAGQLKTILLLCADRGVERDPPATERAAHELIKVLAALPKRRAGRGGASR